MYFVTIEATYDLIKHAHAGTGHGRHDRMEKELGKKYANIPREALQFYRMQCMQCQKKKKRGRFKGIAVKPILSEDLLSRVQIDLIDMQSMAKGQYKWIFLYQDHFTKFCTLRALSSKRASEVALHLLDFFLTLSAPAILQSDSGAEFTTVVITEVCKLWPELKIVHGKPRMPQSQGSVESKWRH